MTPYAILLVRPADTDATIRARYHQLIQDQHPDRGGASGVPGPLWYTYTEAYCAVKTAPVRAAWLAKHSVLRGLCKPCKGSGVAGSRVAGGKVKHCPACKGEGRV